MRRNNDRPYKNEVNNGGESSGNQPLTDGGVATQSAAATTPSTDSPWKHEQTLRFLYHRRGMTTREIADEFDCSNGTVSRWLNKHGISTRDNWREGVKAARQVNREERVAVRTLPAGYEYWAQKDPDRTNRIVYVHRLLAVAEYGYDAVADNDVHHKNQIPWDNRPENIELMDHSDHGRMHSQEYWQCAAGEDDSSRAMTDGGVDVGPASTSDMDAAGDPGDIQFALDAMSLDDVSVSVEDDRYAVTVRGPDRGTLDGGAVIDLVSQHGLQVKDICVDIEAGALTIEVDQ